MATSIKIGGNTYPAIINGCKGDKRWDGRDTKTITLEMTHEQATTLFVDDEAWSILLVPDEDPDAEPEEYDNSDYCVAGDIIDHRDGTISVVMGRETDLEEAYELLYGGE